MATLGWLRYRTPRFFSFALAPRLTTASLVLTTASLVLATAPLLALAVSGCSAPQTRAPSQNVERPACLSVQENDRHVEFDGRSLLLAENGTPKKLALDNGREVVCEKLEVIGGNVSIRYRTQSQILKNATASIANAAWITAPR